MSKAPPAPVAIFNKDYFTEVEAWLNAKAKALEDFEKYSKGEFEITCSHLAADTLNTVLTEHITPATKAVFGLNAQPFAPDYGAVPGEVQDPGRGNVNVTLARKAALQTECRRLGLDAAGTTATLVEFLISQGAAVDVPNKNGVTSLMAAAVMATPPSCSISCRRAPTSRRLTSSDARPTPSQRRLPETAAAVKEWQETHPKS